MDSAVAGSGPASTLTSLCSLGEVAKSVVKRVHVICRPCKSGALLHSPGPQVSFCGCLLCCSRAVCVVPAAFVPMVLYVIGLGLGDEKDITVRGLEAVRGSTKVVLEHYTSILGVDKAKLVSVAIISRAHPLPRPTTFLLVQTLRVRSEATSSAHAIASWYR